MTAVPIVIRFGQRTKARIRTREGNWKDILISSLKQYVTEELNPENQKGVQGLEVFVSSPLLSSGMGIVDTPGLGPVFTGNTPPLRPSYRISMPRSSWLVRTRHWRVKS